MSSTPPYPSRDRYPMSPPIALADSSGNPSSFPFNYPGPPHMYPKITADNADDIALRNLMQPMTISRSTYDHNFGFISSPTIFQPSTPIEIIIPPRTVILGYNPGFEFPSTPTTVEPEPDEVEIIIPPRTFDLGYDPGFELPAVSTTPEPSDAVEPINPPRTVILDYNPGFEFPPTPTTPEPEPEPSDEVEILIPPRTFDLGYYPGFELPAVSTTPEPSDAVEIIIPPRTFILDYNPGFELPLTPTTPDPEPESSDEVEILIPTKTVDLGYDPGFKLPSVSTAPEASDTVEVVIPPRTVNLDYNPGFELPEYTNSPENLHLNDTCDPDDSNNLYPATRNFLSEKTFYSALLGSHDSYGQTSCDPDDDIRGPPPPVGFIFQHPDLPNEFAYPKVSYPSLSGSALVLESQKEGAVSKENQCRWVGASSSDCNVQGAFLVGHDQDGCPIYAGRAYHNGDNIPAKVIPSKQVAYISYNGEEIIKDQFEMMCAPVFSWQWSSGGNIPHGAVEFGNTADGEILYLGRVNHEGSLTPGKVQRSHGCCYFPFGGLEVSSQTYEILVLS